MTDEEVFMAVRIELRSARRQHPNWPEDMVHAASVITEEQGEVIKAVNNVYWKQGHDTIMDIRYEAIQAMTTLVRFLTETPGIH